MQKINFQDLPNTTTPINSTNLNLIQTNVENAYEPLKIYSTTEQVIGTYDGDTLYRKIIDLGSLNAGGVKNVSHNISNLNKITNIMCIGSSSTHQFPIPFVGNSYMFSSASFGIRISSSEVTVYCPQDVSITAIITLEYTKTTN